MKRQQWFLAGILILQGVLYFATYSSVPASDGTRYIHDMEISHWGYILLPNHMFYEVLFLALKKALTILGLSISMLKIMQIANTILAVLAGFLFFKVLDGAKLKPVISLAGTFLFVFSFSLWFFANGEIHHQSLFCILLAFYLAGVVFPKQPSVALASLIAVLSVIACTLHEEHFLFVFPLSWLLLTYNFRPVFNRFLVIYWFIFALLASWVFGMVAYFAYQVRSLPDFMNWMYVYHEHAKTGHLSTVHQSFHWFRLLKGALMAFNYGAQIIVDWVRYSEIRNNRRVWFYLILTGWSAVLICFLLARVFLDWKILSKSLRRIAVGMLIWTVVYKVIVNGNLFPESPEYHLASLAPWLFLVLIGIHLIKQKQIQEFVVFSLILSTFSVNLFAGILPARSYGKMINEFSHFANVSFLPSDLLLSTESTLEDVPNIKCKQLSIKGIFLTSEKTEGFKWIEKNIAETLRHKGRVFICDFIPGKYALWGINFYNHKSQFSVSDFENAFLRLKEKYGFIPFYQYWEKDDSQLYRFDQTHDTLWQVVKRNQ